MSPEFSTWLNRPPFADPNDPSGMGDGRGGVPEAGVLNLDTS